MPTTEDINIPRGFKCLDLRAPTPPDWNTQAHAPLDAPDYCPRGGTVASNKDGLQVVGVPIYGRAYW